MNNSKRPYICIYTKNNYPCPVVINTFDELISFIKQNINELNVWKTVFLEARSNDMTGDNCDFYLISVDEELEEKNKRIKMKEKIKEMIQEDPLESALQSFYNVVDELKGIRFFLGELRRLQNNQNKTLQEMNENLRRKI